MTVRVVKLGYSAAPWRPQVEPDGSWWELRCRIVGADGRTVGVEPVGFDLRRDAEQWVADVAALILPGGTIHAAAEQLAT